MFRRRDVLRCAAQGFGAIAPEQLRSNCCGSAAGSEAAGCIDCTLIIWAANSGGCRKADKPSAIPANWVCDPWKAHVNMHNGRNEKLTDFGGNFIRQVFG
jgi:hypothetical protein